MIPWELYDLTPRDQGSPNVRPFNEVITGATAGASSSSLRTITVPDDYCLLVTAVSSWAQTPGTNVRGHEIRATDRTGGISRANIVDEFSSVLTGLQYGKTWSGSPLMLLLPGDRIGIIANLVAASTPAWTHWVSVQGVLIPRGTISIS